eukprot:1589371-Pleurochrysis_carterae.AAC.1
MVEAAWGGGQSSGGGDAQLYGRQTDASGPTANSERPVPFDGMGIMPHGRHEGSKRSGSGQPSGDVGAPGPRTRDRGVGGVGGGEGGEKEGSCSSRGGSSSSGGGIGPRGRPPARVPGAAALSTPSVCAHATVTLSGSSSSGAGRPRQARTASAEAAATITTTRALESEL